MGKAAAKLHLRLNLQSFLPQCVIIGTAAEHDSKRARELCAGISEGEIVVFDKAYVDFDHLGELDQRKVFWVTRAKENMVYRVQSKLPVKRNSKILRDEIISLEKPSALASELMRRVVALVELDGKEQEMVFLSNHLDWSPQSIADLYRCRWQIETFFKQIKQTLQLADFLGHNANAVRWQVWTALLVYVLLRFQAFASRWSHGFCRLFTLLRAALWQKLDLFSLLQSYGTAGGSFKLLSAPYQAYLPGLA